MSMLKPYEEILKNWDKSYGPKPTIRQLKDIEKAGLARTGSKTAFALAMLMNETSQVQIKKVLGAAYRNRANQLAQQGLISLKNYRSNGRTRYRLEVGTVRKLGNLVEHAEQRITG